MSRSALPKAPISLQAQRSQYKAVAANLIYTGGIDLDRSADAF